MPSRAVTVFESPALIGLTGCRSDRRRKELLLEDRSFLLSKKRKHLMSCLAAAERFFFLSKTARRSCRLPMFCGCNCVKLFPGRSGCVDGILYSCISGALKRGSVPDYLCF